MWEWCRMEIVRQNVKQKRRGTTKGGRRKISDGNNERETAEVDGSPTAGRLLSETFGRNWKNGGQGNEGKTPTDAASHLKFQQSILVVLLQSP